MNSRIKLSDKTIFKRWIQILLSTMPLINRKLSQQINRRQKDIKMNQKFNRNNINKWTGKYQNKCKNDDFDLGYQNVLYTVSIHLLANVALKYAATAVVYKGELRHVRKNACGNKKGELSIFSSHLVLKNRRYVSPFNVPCEKCGSNLRFKYDHCFYQICYNFHPPK